MAQICKTFRAFIITFLKLKENHQMVNTPDFTLNYFLKPQRLEPSGADPGFPIGGDAKPSVGRQHMILPNFVKNCMKLRKFWAVGGHMLGVVAI